jgi:hypothetical protein
MVILARDWKAMFLYYVDCNERKSGMGVVKEFDGECIAFNRLDGEPIFAQKPRAKVVLSTYGHGTINICIAKMN